MTERTGIPHHVVEEDKDGNVTHTFIQNVDTLSSLFELATGRVGFTWLPRWFTRMIFYLAFATQVAMVWVIVLAKSLISNPVLSGTKQEVDFECRVDTFHSYHYSAVVFLTFFASLTAGDTMSCFWAVWAVSKHSKRLDEWAWAVVGLQLAMSMVLAAGVGLILASGNTVDNVIKNSLSIFVLMQIDDALLAMLNAFSEPRADIPFYVIQRWKRGVLDDGTGSADPKVIGWKQVMTTRVFAASWIGPFLAGLVTWLVKLHVEDWDC